MNKWNPNLGISSNTLLAQEIWNELNELEKKRRKEDEAANRRVSSIFQMGQNIMDYLGLGRGNGGEMERKFFWARARWEKWSEPGVEEADKVRIFSPGLC